MGIDDFLSNYAEPEQELCFRIGDLIRSKFPDILENVDLPAKMIAYSYGPTYKQLLFTVFPSKKGVKLGFNQGVQLNNEHGLLQGTGKISRYIQFYKADELQHPAVVELLDEGYRLYLVRTGQV